MRKLALALAFSALPLFAADQPTPPADLANPPADAVRAENGLVTKILTPGNGGTERLADDGLARVRYTVWKSDGTLVQHLPAPRSAVIGKSKMLPGWGTAVQQMAIGEVRRAWIPSSLGAGKIKEGETFVIDTELLELIEAPKTPEDVAAVPADASRTASGIAYKVLRPGSGTTHPRRTSVVTVHYSGWTTDGKLFDSSLLKGEPAEFRLTGVIKGWTEGVQLMVEGEKRRFWIPARLAYGNDRKMPQGMLVFDIELLKIK